MPYVYPPATGGSGETHPRAGVRLTALSGDSIDVWDHVGMNTVLQLSPADFILEYPETISGAGPVTHLKVLPLGLDPDSVGTWVPVTTPDVACYTTAGCGWTNTGTMQLSVFASTDGVNANFGAGGGWLNDQTYAIVSDADGHCGG